WTGAPLADASDDRVVGPLVHEDEVDAVQSLVEIERRRVVAARTDARIGPTCEVERLLAVLLDEVLDATGAPRLEDPHVVAPGGELGDDATQEVGGRMVPVAQQGMTEERY